MLASDFLLSARWGRTEEIDFLAAVPADHTLSLRRFANREIIGVVGRFRCIARVGTPTGSVGWQIGTNATRDNFIPSANGGLNIAGITALSAGSTAALNAGVFAVLATGQLSLRRTLIPTGLTEFRGFIEYVVIYSEPVPA